MRTSKQIVIEQMNLFHDIQRKANINIVTCGHCGTILLHKIDEIEEIECFGCMKTLSKSDCPDYWYSGEDEMYND